MFNCLQNLQGLNNCFCSILSLSSAPFITRQRIVCFFIFFFFLHFTQGVFATLCNLFLFYLHFLSIFSAPQFSFRVERNKKRKRKERLLNRKCSHHITSHRITLRAIFMLDVVFLYNAHLQSIFTMITNISRNLVGVTEFRTIQGIKRWRNEKKNWRKRSSIPFERRKNRKWKRRRKKCRKLFILLQLVRALYKTQ